MAVKTKWAIIGTGYIANQFVSGMRAVEDAILEAVVSRSENSGKKFAQKYGCEKVYTDLKTMLDTEKIDIVYLAIPNSCHFEYIMEILERGIPVLSEKPMVDNGKQLTQVLNKAKEKNTFLMEGMWTRCFPAVIQTRNWIKEGRIGKPLTVRAGFDIKPDIALESRNQICSRCTSGCWNLFSWNGVSGIPGRPTEDLFQYEIKRRGR